MVGGRYGAGIDVCGRIRGDISNTRVIAETTREGATINNRMDYYGGP